MKMRCSDSPYGRLFLGRLGVVRGVQGVDARVVGIVAGAVGGRGVGVRCVSNEEFGNWWQRKSVCTAVVSIRGVGGRGVVTGVARGVGLGLEDFRPRSFSSSSGSRRTRARKISMTEGAADMAEFGYAASDAGGGERVNVVGGASLVQQAGGAGDGGSSVVDHGFTRPEMYSQSLVGTVAHYERHVFLCYKEPESWPARIEAAEFDRLPRFFVAALRARKNDMPKKTRLTICEGRDGTDSSSGDVLIFPDMVRYRGLTHFDVDTFVEDVLVKGKDWVGSAKPDPLVGSHIFVCAHGSRDTRCGVCGSALIQKFREEIAARGLEAQIFVRPCSHIGGHKYAGNVIIFSKTGSGQQVSGHWYGYVVPEDISALLDQHIGKGEIIRGLWRGEMGLAEEDQKLAHEQRMRCQQEGANGCACAESQVGGPDGEGGESASPCCQTVKCEEEESAEAKGSGLHDETNGEVLDEVESPSAEVTNSAKLVQSDPESLPVKSWSCSFFKMPKWIQTWEREDTHAALAVLGVAALVTVAVHLHRRSVSS